MSTLSRLREDALCQRTLDLLPFPIRVWTPDEGVVFVNSSWLELTGTTQQDNGGDGWLRCVHEEDRAAVAATAAPDLGARREYRVATRGGGHVRVTDAPSAWTETVDGTSRLVGVLHACTMQDQPATPQQQGVTLSKWAHELRGPLNAILGWSDLLSNGEQDLEVIQRGLKAIASNARQQAAIIKRMTD